MNVSQSATLKDVEFIIDALLYQNITKLLIVITRADTGNKQQLQEVINYTKTSIELELKKQNKDSQLNYILDTIKFVPISGKMALLHRTNKSSEAIEAGFTLEQTGILEIESYLNENLFGSSSIKSELIIKSSKAQLLRLSLKAKESLIYELKLSSKSKEELKVELKIFEQRKEKDKHTLSSITDDINYYKDDSKHYIESLENFLKNEFAELQIIIKQRVVSDVRYSLEKTKKKPNNTRIKIIVQTAIKDGIIDVIRDYKYKFTKKFQTISEQCELKYKKFGFSLSDNCDIYNTAELFKDDFKSGFLTSSNAILINKIIVIVEKSKSNDINALDKDLNEIIKEEFITIEENIKEKTKTISVHLLNAFFDILNLPIITVKQKITKDEALLSNQLASYEDDEEKRSMMAIQIHKKLKNLESVISNIKGETNA
jgi:hypothetical protein